MAERQYGDDVIEAVLARLAGGLSLVAVCRGAGMPSARSVQKWARADDEFAERLRQAREDGFMLRAERAVEAAKAAKDPHAGRLAFDAERWYLGKLSNAFRDKPLVGVSVNVDGSDAFEAFTGALEEARAARAGLADRTTRVALPSPPGTGDAARGMADMAPPGGERVREDPDGG